MRLATNVLFSLAVSVLLLWPVLQRTDFSMAALLSVAVAAVAFLLIFLVAGATRRALPYLALSALSCSVAASLMIAAADQVLHKPHSWLGLTAVLWVIVLITAWARVREMRCHR